MATPAIGLKVAGASSPLTTAPSTRSCSAAAVSRVAASSSARWWDRAGRGPRSCRGCERPARAAARSRRRRAAAGDRDTRADPRRRGARARPATVAAPRRTAPGRARRARWARRVRRARPAPHDRPARRARRSPCGRHGLARPAAGRRPRVAGRPAPPAQSRHSSTRHAAASPTHSVRQRAGLMAPSAMHPAPPAAGRGAARRRGAIRTRTGKPARVRACRLAIGPPRSAADSTSIVRGRIHSTHGLAELHIDHRLEPPRGPDHVAERSVVEVDQRGADPDAPADRQVARDRDAGSSRDQERAVARVAVGEAVDIEPHAELAIAEPDRRRGAGQRRHLIGPAVEDRGAADQRADR